MTVYSFETPSRQSLKGVIIIFAINLFKTIKKSIAVIFVFAISYIRDFEIVNNHGLKVVLGFGIFLIILLVISILKYVTFKFRVDENYFFLNKGIINKEQITISKSKIQNVYIKQNFVQQLINVVALSIETAGDDKTEIEIHAMSKQKAKALKEVLLKHNSDEINIDPVAEDIYFKASIKQLILEGISENHFKSLAFILVLFTGVYRDFRGYIDSFEIETKFKHYFEFDEFDIATFIVFNISLVIIVLIIAFLFSLIKIIIINFNLKVVRTANGLEISKGLFNKISLHLKKKRIQSITLKTNRFKQFLGLYSLRFTQTMGSKKQKERLSIIGLNKLKSNELIRGFYRDVFKNSNKQHPEKYFMRVQTIRWSFIVLLINIPMFLVSRYTLFLNIPILLLILLHVRSSYKKAYFDLDDMYLIKGSGGAIETRTDFLELHKIQSVELTQSVFQRRRDIASVIIYTGSKGFTIPHITRMNAQRIIDYILFKVESQHKDWM
ncbi:PH domain-containing protein [Flavivirga aquimarina]|uniref:PH domain-containing protein n=1 Tax=Flavivirga aquimarina TaxID=2027862 RepID=A0ABT8WGA5_9FLAO|nr:PH domain-containing protein [Flavivirga aquimarina]MDO5972083.1 PH domain-containing protein [Flavivirga aquimarina]